MDLDNYNNDTVDGLHITSMSGSWLAIVQGFAGMRYNEDGISFAPFLPKKWSSYSFKINYRGHILALAVEKDKEVKLTLLSGEDLPVKVWDQEVTLKEGQSQCLKD